jgi:F1F0 ATPase subunit 2
MNEFVFLASPLAAGLLLGAFFFGALWWTIIRGVSSQRAIVPVPVEIGEAGAIG